MSQWSDKLTSALEGRSMPKGWTSGPKLLTLWGSDLGFAGDDIHCDRVYQLTLCPDQEGRIARAELSVVGDLISPCSGYRSEELDEEDYPLLQAWCDANL